VESLAFILSYFANLFQLFAMRKEDASLNMQNQEGSVSFLIFYAS